MKRKVVFGSFLLQIVFFQIVSEVSKITHAKYYLHGINQNILIKKKK